MKIFITNCRIIIILSLFFGSCNDEMSDYNEPVNAVNLKQFKNTIVIDSAYI